MGEQPVRRLTKVLLTIVVGFGVLAASPFLWQEWVNARGAPKIYSVADAPSARVAVVFGARVLPGGRLSAMLMDRVETAVQLYHNGKVEKLLLSGDNSSLYYNEPDAMAAYALERGVPAADIQTDYAGLRTYDTCYRPGPSSVYKMLCL